MRKRCKCDVIGCRLRTRECVHLFGEALRKFSYGWLQPDDSRKAIPYWSGRGLCRMVRNSMSHRMYPLTLEGLDRAKRRLTR